MWEDFSGTVGFCADMDDPYVTYHDDFIESEWWALKTIWDKGLLYKNTTYMKKLIERKYYDVRKSIDKSEFR